MRLVQCLEQQCHTGGTCKSHDIERDLGARSAKLLFYLLQVGRDVGNGIPTEYDVYGQVSVQRGIRVGHVLYTVKDDFIGGKLL